MASEDVQTNLRLPADLKDRLVASAAENNRSLSAEVSSRLSASYEEPVEEYATKSQLERIFKKIAREQNEVMLGISLVRDMLGSYVKVLFARLSKADQSKDEYRVMYDLAKAAIDADSSALTLAASRKMANTPGMNELENAESFFKFLGEVNKMASDRRRKMIDEEPDDGGGHESKP